MTEEAETKPAILGGQKAVHTDPADIFTWPIITKEDEEAVLEVLRRGGMSGTDVTIKLEQELAEWQGTQYALGFSTGTAALQAAMWGCGVRTGDEIIGPSMTYWASCLPCFSLGATVAFADIDRDTLCLDPNDIEHRITKQTKAIVVVHWAGYPADMDPIMAIAKKHKIKVIEDVSHAHGGIYKGKKLGTIGDVGAMSCMSGKALAIGEAGMLVTDSREIYEHGIAWGHYGRFDETIETESLKPFIHLPMGGYKYRMHQLSAAVGRVQLRHYDARNQEILKAMHTFWDLLEGVPGIKAHRPPKNSGSDMGGWYAACGLYRAEELGGLSVSRFCQAVSAEGVPCTPGVNRPLHLHPLFNTADVYGHGKPTRTANTSRDMHQDSLPVSETIGQMTFSVPWFKHYRPEIIKEYASAFRKAAEHADSLLPDDKGNSQDMGGWHHFTHT